MTNAVDVPSLETGLRKIIERYGEWTDHNIHLGGNLYTIGPDTVPDKLRRTVQVVADLVGKPLDQVRVLDLACLEGMYAIEFARHGAEVVGIEGREANIAKAQFAKNALRLDKLTFVQGDIRELSPERHGYFDVVLCLGVFYHLDAPAVFRLVEQMNSVCRRLLYMDTYVGMSNRQTYIYGDHTYHGVSVHEHKSTATDEQKKADLWASLDNERSVWLTKPSLLNLLEHSGFTSAYECRNPSEIDKTTDRVSIVAIKGERPQLHCVPKASTLPIADWPEYQRVTVNAAQKRFYDFSKRYSLVPGPLRRGLKNILRSVGLRKPSQAPFEWDEPFKKRQK